MAPDGILYKDEYEEREHLHFPTQTDIEGTIENVNTVQYKIDPPTLSGNYAKIITTDLGAPWNPKNKVYKQSHWFVTNINLVAYPLVALQAVH